MTIVTIPIFLEQFDGLLNNIYFSRFLFSLQIILAEIVFAVTLKKRRLFTLKFILSLLLYPSLSVVIAHLAGMIHGSLELMSIFLLSMAFFPLCVEVDFWGTLFCCVAASVLQNLAYNAGSLISTAFGILPDLSTNPQSALIQIPIYTVVHILVFLICGRRIKGSTSYGVEKIPAICLTAFSVLVIYVVQFFMQRISIENLYFLEILFPCCDIMALFMLFGMHERSKLERENAILQQIMTTQSKQYEISMRTIEMINLKYHDLKHQLSLLKKANSADQLASIEELEELVDTYDAIVNTGNKALDVVLSSKIMLCEKYRITLTYLIDGEKLYFMSTSDIYSLFGNALDNAIEAVKHIEPEKRIIILNLSTQGCFVGIHMENYCAKPLVFSGGLPITTKENTEYHGYGLKSIKYIAEKYQGVMSTEIRSNMFCLDVLMPVITGKDQSSS